MNEVMDLKGESITTNLLNQHNPEVQLVPSVTSSNLNLHLLLYALMESLVTPITVVLSLQHWPNYLLVDSCS